MDTMDTTTMEPHPHPYCATCGLPLLSITTTPGGRTIYVCVDGHVLAIRSPDHASECRLYPDAWAEAQADFARELDAPTPARVG